VYLHATPLPFITMARFAAFGQWMLVIHTASTFTSVGDLLPRSPTYKVAHTGIGIALIVAAAKFSSTAAAAATFSAKSRRQHRQHDQASHSPKKPGTRKCVGAGHGQISLSTRRKVEKLGEFRFSPKTNWASKPARRKAQGKAAAQEQAAGRAPQAGAGRANASQA
jgi:hypothetical protein